MLPIDTYASEVVFYRHVKRLVEEGHEIHILTDSNSYARRKKELHPSFKIHFLPNRKWHFPPYKALGMLQKLRFFYYYHFITKQIISSHKIDTLLGYVYGVFLGPFCAYVQKKTNLPLYSFFHDDTVELHFNKNEKIVRNNTIKILDRSKKVFIASQSFKENWLSFAEKFVLLYPISDSKEVSQTNAVTQPTIGYAGSVYNEIIPSLEKVGAILNEESVNLVIIGNNDNARYIADKYTNVTYKPLFDTAEEANNFLINNCSACIIPYPEKISEMPWIKTCFPSKLIQNTLLNIPTIVIAPHDSALGKWCLENRWLLYTSKYEKRALSKLLSMAIHSQEVKTQIGMFKNKEFNADIIHEKFKTYILK